MMQNGNIPNDIKNLLNNMKNTTNHENSDSNSSVDSSNMDTSTPSEQNAINPDMLKNFMNMFNQSSNNNSSNSNETSGSTPNIDINMLLKMKAIMEKMNNGKDDPRSNLLLSLKPYLKESRKSKVEQYIQLFNMSKVLDVLNPNGGEKSK